MTTNIDVRFATPLPVEIMIRRLNGTSEREARPLLASQELAARTPVAANEKL